MEKTVSDWNEGNKNCNFYLTGQIITITAITATACLSHFAHNGKIDSTTLKNFLYLEKFKNRKNINCGTLVELFNNKKILSC